MTKLLNKIRTDTTDVLQNHKRKRKSKYHKRLKKTVPTEIYPF